MAAHLFDPDDVDLSNDPEYLAMIRRIGPANGVLWAEGQAAIAKRAEMLDIDREMSTAWMRAMEKLLLMDLSDEEFTAQRMLRLRLWTRERKRRQHNLHYKYDPSRRNPRLVRVDTDQQLQRTRQRLQERLAQFEAVTQARRSALPEAAPAAPEARPEPERAPRALRAPERRPRPSITHRDEAFIPAPAADERQPAKAPEPAVPPFIPDYLSPAAFELIVRDTGLTDPARATDEKILEAYERKGMTGYPAEYFLALLRGRTPPPHPDEA